jgi:Fur family ferric uptake transcriptional regulator
MSHDRTECAVQIREQGFRVTPQRLLLLDAICEGNGHTTFDEIYRRVRSKAPGINQATVYRTLDFLCDLRLDRQRDTPPPSNLSGLWRRF